MDSTDDTNKHRFRVHDLLRLICAELERRGGMHDLSKLGPDEKPGFDEFTPKLAGSTYGSEEYKGFLVAMKEACLDHHYATNSHHPEHFEDGVTGMSLLDVVEMLADWKAASERHEDGDIIRSLEVNAERFSISPQLLSILKNTVEEMGWTEQ